MCGRYPPKSKSAGHPREQDEALVRDENVILDAAIVYDALNISSNQHLPGKIAFEHASSEEDIDWRPNQPLQVIQGPTD